MKYLMLSCVVLFSGCLLGNDFEESDVSVTLSSPTATSAYIVLEHRLGDRIFRLFRYFAEGGELEFLATMRNGTSYLDTGLQPATRYIYRLSYINSDGNEVFFDKELSIVTSPHIIAHRGYHHGISGSAENSIQSLRRAAILGVYGSEFDVHVTADNIPVVYHDHYINGTDIKIQQVTYDTIRNVTLSNGERIPTLAEYFEAARTLDIQLFLDLKPHFSWNRDEEIVQIVSDKVRYFGLENRVTFLVTRSYLMGHPIVGRYFKERVGVLFGQNAYLEPSKAKALGFSMVAYHYNVLLANPEYFCVARSLGLTLAVWTLNDLSLMEDMASHGIRYVITSLPSFAKEFFANRLVHFHFEM